MKSWISKTDSPFKDQPRLIFHGAYHKMGTIWITNLLRRIGEAYGLSIQISNRNDELHDGSNILIANHSQTNLSLLEDYVGTHLIRDPRDAIVSGYFYHLWTEEEWAHQPQDEFDGMSYQVFLKSQTQEEGLKTEIRRFATYIEHYRLLEWDYQNPKILELRYETLIQNEGAEFQRAFQHYGFHERAIRKCLNLADAVGFKNVARRKIGEENQQSHLRSGKPNQWAEILNEEHKQLIKERFGNVLARMGYESDNDW